MATYVIGDVHGCYDGLMGLLELINFKNDDHLILLGDLINKGPDSTAVVDWVMQQSNCDVVLGNHDLYVLYNLIHQRHKPSPTAQLILNQSNSDDILNWLQQQPLLIAKKNAFFCHAGIYPDWTDANIQYILKHQSSFLQPESLKTYFDYTKHTEQLHIDDSRFIIKALTEMRFLNRKDHSFVRGTDDNQDDDPEKIAWFDITTIKYTKKTVFFGHWARLSQLNNHHTVCMDGGYVYGGELLGIRLEDGQLFKLKNQQTNL